MPMTRKRFFVKSVERSKMFDFDELEKQSQQREEQQVSEKQTTDAATESRQNIPIVPAEAESPELEAGSEAWALAADFLWDGESDHSECGLCIIVQDGRIMDICSLDKAEERCGQRVQRFPGCCVIPGLIDAHCHLEFSEDYPLHQQPSLSLSGKLAAAERRANSMLLRGITTVRDLGGSEAFTALELRNEIASGRRQGPRIWRGCLSLLPTVWAD